MNGRMDNSAKKPGSVSKLFHNASNNKDKPQMLIMTPDKRVVPFMTNADGKGWVQVSDYDFMRHRDDDSSASGEEDDVSGSSDDEPQFGMMNWGCDMSGVARGGRKKVTMYKFLERMIRKIRARAVNPNVCVGCFGSGLQARLNFKLKTRFKNDNKLDGFVTLIVDLASRAFIVNFKVWATDDSAGNADIAKQLKSVQDAVKALNNEYVTVRIENNMVMSGHVGYDFSHKYAIAALNNVLVTLVSKKSMHVQVNDAGVDMPPYGYHLPPHGAAVGIRQQNVESFREFIAESWKCVRDYSVVSSKKLDRRDGLELKVANLYVPLQGQTCAPAA